MKHLLPADGANEDRRFPRVAEDLSRSAGLRHVHQTTGAELISLESSAVGFKGEVVINAGGHVSPMRGRKHFAGGFFEIHDREHVAQRGRGRGRSRAGLLRVRHGMRE
jgi:hypothetical protein